MGSKSIEWARAIVAAAMLAILGALLHLALAAVCEGAVPREAVVRVERICRDGMMACGSGTIVDLEPGDRFLQVITNNHVVGDGAGVPYVQLHDGRVVSACNQLRRDPSIDLCVFDIVDPGVAPAKIYGAYEGQEFTRAGWGPSPADRYAEQTGRILKVARQASPPYVQGAWENRSGDSGGGVFDARGRLVAVCFGQAQDGSYNVDGASLIQWLNDKVYTQVDLTQCYGGSCYQYPDAWASAPQQIVVQQPNRTTPQPVIYDPPATPAPNQGCACDPAEFACNCDPAALVELQGRLDAALVRIDQLESREPATGPAGPRGPAGPPGPAGEPGPPGDSIDIDALAQQITQAVVQQVQAGRPDADADAGSGAIYFDLVPRGSN